MVYFIDVGLHRPGPREYPLGDLPESVWKSFNEINLERVGYDLLHEDAALPPHIIRRSMGTPPTAEELRRIKRAFRPWAAAVPAHEGRLAFQDQDLEATSPVAAKEDIETTSPVAAQEEIEAEIEATSPGDADCDLLGTEAAFHIAQCKNVCINSFIGVTQKQN